MKEVVLDASVTAKWELPDEPFAWESDQFRLRVRSEGLRLIQPRMWSFEVASIFSKAVAGGRLLASDAEQALIDTLGFAYAYAPEPTPIQAYRLARRYDRSLIDSLYLAIAEERGCEFWTDDRKLVRGVSPRFPFVRWIGDYPAPDAAQGQEL